MRWARKVIDAMQSGKPEWKTRITRIKDVDELRKGLLRDASITVEVCSAPPIMGRVFALLFPDKLIVKTDHGLIQIVWKEVRNCMMVEDVKE